MLAQNGTADALNDHRYIYDAECVKVVDGDTLKLEVDLGLDCRRSITIRLYGINAPEVRGPEREEGIVSREALRDLIDNSTGGLIIQTIRDKTGKYGRYLAKVYGDQGQVFGEELVRLGLAKAVDYGKKKKKE